MLLACQKVGHFCDEQLAVKKLVRNLEEWHGQRSQRGQSKFTQTIFLLS
jgi:hypothetical protein